MFKRIVKNVKRVIDSVANIVAKVKAIFKRVIELRAAVRNGESINSFGGAFILVYSIVRSIVKAIVLSLMFVIIINGIAYLIFGDEK